MKKLLCVLMFGMMFGQDAITTREYTVEIFQNTSIDIYDLVGENASGRYNAHNDISSISDTNKHSTFKPVSGDITSETMLNQESIGESPGRKYELQKLKLALLMSY